MNYIKYNDTIKDVRGLVVRPVYNVTELVIRPNELCIGIPFKSADTIEELLNRYITVKHGSYKIYTKLQFGKLRQSEVLKMLASGFYIYGAIWTANGLKYVAEMNKEGKWKLL